MRRGVRRINQLYLGIEGEEGIKDITRFFCLSGAINRSRGQQSRSRFGRRKHKFNFENTEWRCWLGIPDVHWASGDGRLQCSKKAWPGDEAFESSLCQRQTGQRGKRHSMSERLPGLRCELLDASFGGLQFCGQPVWLFFFTFFLFLTVLGMPRKWLTDEWIIALYMQIHEIYLEVIWNIANEVNFTLSTVFIFTWNILLCDHREVTVPLGVSDPSLV